LSKQLYVSSLSSYYIFYLIDKFGVSTQGAQFYSSSSLPAMRPAPILRRPLGAASAASNHLVLDPRCAAVHAGAPYAGLFASAVLTVFIGPDLSSATSSIIVSRRTLMPHALRHDLGRVLGVAFGIGGLAPPCSQARDHTGIAFVYQVCAFLAGAGIACGCSCEDAEAPH